MKVELREINDRNREECIALHVTPEQLQYVASNEDSLRDAQEESAVARPFAIYIDGKMVGFTMFAIDEENEDPHDKYWLWRFMIDSSLQGKGYGKAALKEIIEYFRVRGMNEITLCTKASNAKALSLYHKFGFKENGQKNGEEDILKCFLGGETVFS